MAPASIGMAFGGRDVVDALRRHREVHGRRRIGIEHDVQLGAGAVGRVGGPVLDGCSVAELVASIRRTASRAWRRRPGWASFRSTSNSSANSGRAPRGWHRRASSGAVPRRPDDRGAHDGCRTCPRPRAARSRRRAAHAGAPRVGSSSTAGARPCRPRTFPPARSKRPHGIGFIRSCKSVLWWRMARVSPCSTKPASSRITEKSTPCPLSIRNEPDSRGLGPRTQGRSASCSVLASDLSPLRSTRHFEIP